MSVPSYKRHRFPREVIAHAVWLYYRFALSFRDIEEMLASRGVMVSYEAIRLWCGKFGAEYARRLRRHRPKIGRRWHVDEVFIRICGTIHYLWSAVDQNGQVVDILVQKRRDRTAAERFFRHSMKATDTVPHTVVTDRLRSYSAALPHVLPRARHQRGHWLNNRAENSHQPTRDASGACADSSPSGRRNNFFPFTPSFTLISDRDVIGLRPLAIAQFDNNVFSLERCSRSQGARSRLLVRPIRRHRFLPCPNSC